MGRHLSSLTFKLFVICLAFVLMCVAIISSLSSQFVRNQVTERDQEFITQIQSKVNEYLVLNFSSMQTILFSVDSFLESNSFEEFNEFQLGNHLDYVYEMNLQHISNVYVIKEDYSVLGGRTITRVVNDPLSELEQIYKDTKSNRISNSISKPYNSRFTGWTVTVSRMSKSDPSLVIAVDINISELEKKLLQIHEEEQIQMYIVEYSGSILATSRIDSAKLWGTSVIEDTPVEQIVSHNDSIMSVDDASGTEHLILKLHTPTYNWLLVAVSDGTRLAQTLDRIDKYFVNLILFGLLLSLVIAVMITRYIRKPVIHLIQKMRQVEQGNLDVQVTLNRKDEFGYLSRSFDKMLRQLAGLFTDLSEQKELQKRLEIQVLHAQINPHFLYNSLGSISNVVRLGQLHKVDPVIGSLISILEYGIREPSYRVSIQEELSNVRDYLTIQNIRYNREFQLIVDIGPGMEEFKVFRMFLQPIVENSIFHGYRGGREEGDIRIAVYEEDHKAIITVTDYGVGISKDKIADLLAHKDEFSEYAADQRRRIGLANIHGRIKLHYGELYGLTITGELNKGTCVRAEFPLQHEEGA
jgi:two-component system sensor histidine kinase YesM